MHILYVLTLAGYKHEVSPRRHVCYIWLINSQLVNGPVSTCLSSVVHKLSPSYRKLKNIIVHQPYCYFTFNENAASINLHILSRSITKSFQDPKLCAITVAFALQIRSWRSCYWRSYQVSLIQILWIYKERCDLTCLQFRCLRNSAECPY
jgi:hypothetical protein